MNYYSAIGFQLCKTQLPGTLLGTIIQIFILRYKKTSFHIFCLPIDSVHGNFFDKIVIFFLQSSKNCWKRSLSQTPTVVLHIVSYHITFHKFIYRRMSRFKSRGIAASPRPRLSNQIDRPQNPQFLRWFRALTAA